MNKENREIFYNIGSSLIHLALSSVILFYIYRLAKDELGLELIGLWSVIVAIASFGNIGTFGFSGSLVKHTAELKAKQQENAINGMLNSSAVIMMGLLSIFLMAVYGLSLFFLDLIVDIKYVDLGYTLLPYALATFFINALGYLVLSVIEGLNRNWQRNIALIVSQIVFLFAAICLVPKMGILGLFYSQILQAITICIGAWVLIKINLTRYTMFELSKQRQLVKEVISYGVKFQSVSLFQMFCEPVTKFYLSRYGGLSLVGLFEIASRLVVQIRAILLAVVSNLLPKLVGIHSTQSSEKVRISFRNIFGVNYDLFVLSFGLLIVFSPYIIEIWLGQMDNQLILLVNWLSLAWFINSTAIVPYIFNLGSGILKGNVWSHAMMAFFNVILGLMVIVLNLEAIWFVFVWLFSLVVGSGYILFEYRLRNHIKFFSLFTNQNYFVLGLTVAFVIVLQFLHNSSWVDKSIYYTIGSSLYFVSIVVYFLRSKSFQIIKEYFSTFSSLHIGKQP